MGIDTFSSDCSGKKVKSTSGVISTKYFLRARESVANR